MLPNPGPNGLLDGLALGLIALALWTVTLRRIDVAILAVAAQAAALTAAALSIAVAAPDHAGHALLAAGLTAAVKVALIPFVLLLVLARITVRREAAPLLPTRFAVGVAAGLVLVAYWVAAPLHLALGSDALGSLAPAGDPAARIVQAPWPVPDGDPQGGVDAGARVDYRRKRHVPAGAGGHGWTAARRRAGDPG
jgi:hypothetical protein